MIWDYGKGGGGGGDYKKTTTDTGRGGRGGAVQYNSLASVLDRYQTNTVESSSKTSFNDGERRTEN
ncbi:hypothetical protein J6590_051411 [Homalodisca vitripennis]|nr:hypothetical protein J6590_051411 [Homalodisca vitripennis]